MSNAIQEALNRHMAFSDAKYLAPKFEKALRAAGKDFLWAWAGIEATEGMLDDFVFSVAAGIAALTEEETP